LTTTGYPKQRHHISHIKICLKKEANKWPSFTTQLFIKYQYSYMFQPHEVIVRLALEHVDIL
jgi:hypothetical protein